jgi:hypothetical protein
MIKIFYPNKNGSLESVQMDIANKQAFAKIVGEESASMSYASSADTSWKTVFGFALFMLFFVGSGYLIAEGGGAFIVFILIISSIKSYATWHVKEVKADIKTYNNSTI